MESTASSQREREQRFREIYDSVYVDLLRFVGRRDDVPIESTSLQPRRREYATGHGVKP